MWFSFISASFQVHFSFIPASLQLHFSFSVGFLPARCWYALTASSMCAAVDVSVFFDRCRCGLKDDGIIMVSKRYGACNLFMTVRSEFTAWMFCMLALHGCTVCLHCLDVPHGMDVLHDCTA
jgi:hypothetical protein